MEGISLKEKAVFGALAVVVLYALTTLFWFTKVRHTWEESKKILQRTQKTVANEDRLCAAKDDWTIAYDEEIVKIKVLADDTGPDVYWPRVITSMAREHDLTAGKFNTSKETAIDTMRQISMTFDWVGGLEPLIEFLHDLETTDKGSFDVSGIEINQLKGGSTGFLAGTMTVTCIFRRP